MGEYSTYDGQLIRYALDSRQYALKNGHNDLKSVLSLSSHNERLPLSRVEDGTICGDRKSTRLNSSHSGESRMPSSA